MVGCLLLRYGQCGVVGIGQRRTVPGVDEATFSVRLEIPPHSRREASRSIAPCSRDDVCKPWLGDVQAR
jgi:hypothetical protein